MRGVVTASLWTALPLVGLSVATLPAAAQAAVPAARAAWHASVMQARPAGKGCFKASYPDTAWHAVGCIAAPARPLVPRQGPARGGRGLVVGDGADYSAVVSGLISQATGSFPVLTGVTSETNLRHANTYSLQLNTQFFSGSPACNGAGAPSQCLAWEQFVYATPGAVFIQYWLINYAATCPANWYQIALYGQIDCYTNSNALDAGEIPVSALAQVKLLAFAGPDIDAVGVETPSGDILVTNTDAQVGLAAVWNTAEFNIFGDGGGTQANFNRGSTLQVKTEVLGTSTAVPSCGAEGFTGETNNLTLSSCTAVGGSTPLILVTETNKRVK